MEIRNGYHAINDEQLTGVTGGTADTQPWLLEPERTICDHYVCRYCAGRAGAHYSVCRYVEAQSTEIDCCLSCKHIFHADDNAVPRCGHGL